MRRLGYPELLAVTGLNNDRLKVLRQRDQIALAFGQRDLYRSLFYIELDAVAVRLTDVLAEKLDRTLAAQIARDQWGIWSRTVAVAETAPAGMPVLFYVIEFEDKKQQRGYMTTGSLLDSRSDDNLRTIAQDIYQRTGVIPRHFVAVEMGSILADVRRAAKEAAVDLTDRFLPPYGDPRLDEVLRPYDEGRPDRAIIVTGKAKEAVGERARRAGILARAAIEAGLPAAARGRP